MRHAKCPTHTKQLRAVSSNNQHTNVAGAGAMENTTRRRPAPATGSTRPSIYPATKVVGTRRNPRQGSFQARPTVKPLLLTCSRRLQVQPAAMQPVIRNCLSASDAAALPRRSALYSARAPNTSSEAASRELPKTARLLGQVYPRGVGVGPGAATATLAEVMMPTAPLRETTLEKCLPRSSPSGQIALSGCLVCCAARCNKYKHA